MNSMKMCEYGMCVNIVFLSSLSFIFAPEEFPSANVKNNQNLFILVLKYLFKYLLLLYYWNNTFSNGKLKFVYMFTFQFSLELILSQYTL